MEREDLEHESRDGGMYAETLSSVTFLGMSPRCWQFFATSSAVQCSVKTSLEPATETCFLGRPLSCFALASCTSWCELQLLSALEVCMWWTQLSAQAARLWSCQSLCASAHPPALLEVNRESWCKVSVWNLFVTWLSKKTSDCVLWELLSTQELCTVRIN